jgi:hypothetical protein
VIPYNVQIYLPKDTASHSGRCELVTSLSSKSRHEFYMSHRLNFAISYVKYRGPTSFVDAFSDMIFSDNISVAEPTVAQHTDTSTAQSSTTQRIYLHFVTCGVFERGFPTHMPQVDTNFWSRPFRVRGGLPRDVMGSLELVHCLWHCTGYSATVMHILLFGPGHLFFSCHWFLVEAWLGAVAGQRWLVDRGDFDVWLRAMNGRQGKLCTRRFFGNIWGILSRVPVKRQLYECAPASSL